MFKNVTLLIDTSHLAYRSFFALQDLPSDTIRANILYGVLNSIRSLMTKFDIVKLFLVWDRGYTRKRELYAGYKQKKEVMSEEQRVQFVEQFNYLDEFLLCLGMKCCYQEGVEADDVIAFLVRERRIRLQDTEDYITIEAPILIVSGDHDLHPLLKDEEVAMWKPHKERVYTASDFRQEFSGLEPIQYTDVQALSGCPGDKVPGVRGIGQKFAVDLIKRFGSINSIKDTVEEGRLVKLVKDNWKDVELSLKLVEFEEVDPILLCQLPNLGKIRKLLYMCGLVEFIEDWTFIKSLITL